MITMLHLRNIDRYSVYKFENMQLHKERDFRSGFLSLIVVAQSKKDIKFFLYKIVQSIFQKI